MPPINYRPWNPYADEGSPLREPPPLDYIPYTPVLYAPPGGGGGTPSGGGGGTPAGGGGGRLEARDLWLRAAYPDEAVNRAIQAGAARRTAAGGFEWIRPVSHAEYASFGFPTGEVDYLGGAGGSTATGASGAGGAGFGGGGATGGTGGGGSTGGGGGGVSGGGSGGVSGGGGGGRAYAYWYNTREPGRRYWGFGSPTSESGVTNLFQTPRYTGSWLGRMTPDRERETAWYRRTSRPFFS